MDFCDAQIELRDGLRSDVMSLINQHKVHHAIYSPQVLRSILHFLSLAENDRRHMRAKMQHEESSSVI